MYLITIIIPLPYELKLTEAEKVMNEIVTEVDKSDNIKKCEYVGVNEFDQSSVNYMVKVYCRPTKKLQTRRDTLRQIMVVLESHNISIPYQQVDIHEK